jgi:hypothetical protein
MHTDKKQKRPQISQVNADLFEGILICENRRNLWTKIFSHPCLSVSIRG